MQPLSKILIKNLVYTLIIAVIAFLLFKTIFAGYYHAVFWFILIGMSLITAMVHFVLIQLAKYDTIKFSSRFILITGLKMIIFLSFIISYSFLNPNQAVSFLISFLILYIAYSIFEVVIILPFFKR